jgi:hypothetical protein
MNEDFQNLLLEVKYQNFFNEIESGDFLKK